MIQFITGWNLIFFEGDNLDEEEFEALVQEADLEGSESINYEEFVTIMSI